MSPRWALFATFASAAVLWPADGRAQAMDGMQGGRPPPDARDPHAYAEGEDFGPYHLELMDHHALGTLLVENLETTRADGHSLTPFDLEAWFGRTYDRVVFKAEGVVDGGDLEEARTELLWGHAFAAYWDTQIGVRYDSGIGPNREWLALGIEGLAPHRVEVEATAYVGRAGSSALRLDASRDYLLTQRFVLQPRVEASYYGKRDVERGIGTGLSDLSAALRLRYEIRRELAPYIGIEWVRKYGETADLARLAGEDTHDARVVLGLRFWF